MKKGQRPSRHLRNVKTKNGRKNILVNSRLSKKPKGIIRIDERKIFKQLSDPSQYKKEYGGAIDFDKKGEIETIAVIPGGAEEVWVPSDYEVQYHTHPDWETSPPSMDDIESIISNDMQQAEIIFQNGRAFTIIRTSESDKLRKLPKKELHKKLKTLIQDVPKWDEATTKKNLESLGFIIQINDDILKDMKVNVSPVEPKKKGRKGKWE